MKSQINLTQLELKRQKRPAGTCQTFRLEIVVKVAKFLMMTFAQCSNGYLLYGQGLGCYMLLPPPHPYSFIIKLLSLYNMLIFIFLLIHRKLEEKNFSYVPNIYICLGFLKEDFTIFVLLFTAEEKGCDCRFFEKFIFALSFLLFFFALFSKVCLEVL